MTQSESLDKPTENRKSLWTCCLGCIVPFFVFFILVILLLPSIQYAREAARCMLCRSNMKKIGVALQNYHDKHGTFPPAYTVDEEGNPLHSWRTLIIPYFAPGDIEPIWKDIYNKIRFDEPWDSEHNIQFGKYFDDTAEERVEFHRSPDSTFDYHHNMPSVYGCPGCPGVVYTNDFQVKTLYKMIVGDNVIGNSHGTSKSQIKRPLDKTILIIEAQPPVPWMSPSDFTVEDFQTAFFPNDREKVRENREATYWRAPNPELANRPIIGIHGIELNILFVDGTVKKYMRWELPMSEIEMMSRIRE